jgi:hypothetical protein
MQIGSNQLFLMHLAYKKGFITQRDVIDVYQIPKKEYASRSQVILDKLEFLNLIKKTDGTIGYHQQLSKYVLTEKGKKILFARAYKGRDAHE